MATQRPSSSTSKVSKKRKRDHSSSPRWEYEVFLSFYGEDTRRGFTDHLHADLKRKGTVVFRDDEKLQQGEHISQALLKAIQKSQYAIVILSKKYATSKWCLMELAEIVEWEKKKKLITIIPIFYHVDPSDVRHQTGPFAEAFAAHENDPKVDIKKIDMWRNAFREVGTIVGEHINGDKYESPIIQKVCGRISHELNSRSSRLDYSKLVAIDSHADEMMKLLNREPNDVRFIGIHGMGGIGKTMLAEVIYDRVSCLYEGSSFIYFGEESRDRGLASLQQQLLRDILYEKLPVSNIRNGSEVISRRLRNKKVFIVLDEVDSDKQLKAFAGDRKWFGPGSRVIITCRDSHLLITHEVNDIYKVQLLQTADALQLFSLSAFRKTNPPENYKDLSMNFVHYAGGLPLALEVLGRFLFGRTIDAWKSARDQLEANPKKEIFDILKISFDGLEESQQKLFLDMACFYHLKPLPSVNVDYFRETYLAIDFELLVDKSLLRELFPGYLIMHDLLKKMGEEIVRRENPEEPGRRSRLCCKEDVFHVLEKDTGTDAIEGIYLHFHYPDDEKQRFIHVNAGALSKMRKLRFFYIGGFQSFINWHENPLKYMPTDKLQILFWENCPSKPWPSSFQPKNLVVLSMRKNNFERLWEGLMVLDNLKILDLSFSISLIEIPDLSGAPNLEVINLTSCRNLRKVHPSIGTLKQLIKIEMTATGIKQLWNETLMVLPSLKYLNLRNSKQLIEMPDLSGAPNLEKIDFSSCTSLCEVHPSIRFLKRLKHLSLSRCSRLGNFLNILEDMISLESLSLPLSEVSIFPDLSMLECLEEFTAYETAILQIPSINLIPKSICSFELEGVKRMPRESRDLVISNNDCPLSKQSSYPKNHDIGSPVEYEMEEKLWVEIYHLDYSFSKVSIKRCSLGSRIPEWVHNKSNDSSLFFDMCNGSSLKMELDGSMMSVMGIAIFIVCQFHSIPSVDLRELEMEFPIWLDDGTPENPFWKFEFKLSDVILDKPFVLWEYLKDPGCLKSQKLKSLDKQKISTTAKFMWFTDQTLPVEFKVKEWGLHLVCPDDGALGLGSDLDSFVNFINLGLETQHD